MFRINLDKRNRDDDDSECVPARHGRTDFRASYSGRQPAPAMQTLRPTAVSWAAAETNLITQCG